MKSSYAVAVAVPSGAIVLSGSSRTPSAQDRSQSQSSMQQSGSEIARGKYLVEEVARCTECHTPHNADGSLDRARWLAGSAIWIRPTQPISGWADRAPALAGFPGYTDQQAATILEQGRALKASRCAHPCTRIISTTPTRWPSSPISARCRLRRRASKVRRFCSARVAIGETLSKPQPYGILLPL